mmetsp:Transcript_23235/g.36973  ORF Transcript_23235/g.36973 Transcript_23235/m.36973 type:complete len:1080 (+) Transcript_23235:1368-4607(+)
MGSLSPNYTSGRGLRLEKVVGLNVSSKNCVDFNPSNESEIAYPVGCVVVLYCTKTNKQRAYMRMAKPVACVKFSGNGTLLAVGEKGHNPAITVWDVRSHVRVAELKGHRFGISALSFSPTNEDQLVSIGFEHDDSMILWDLKQQVQILKENLEERVVSVDFSADGREILTAGVKHVKFWVMKQDGPDFSITAHNGGLMPDYKDSTFVDVVCGRGELSGLTFLVTECASLICMGTNRLMEKWVFLEAEKAFSLSLSADNSRVACSCGDGISRIFEASSFEFLATLPLPRGVGIPLGHGSQGEDAPIGEEEPVDGDKASYPDTLCIGWGMSGKHVVTVNSDKSLYVWNVQDLQKITKASSFLTHPCSITGIATMPSNAKRSSDNVFVTCSEDNTLRVWKLGGGSKKKRHSWVVDSDKKLWQNNYSNELLREITLTTKDNSGIKCVAVSENGDLIGAGDKMGGVYVYDLVADEEILHDVKSHSGEVLSIQFSPTFDSSGKQVLVTGSRDRQVHVYDVSEKPPKLAQTLKNHSACVTALKFSVDGKKMLSCGGDKTIVLSDVNVDAENISIVRQKSVNVPYGTVHDVDVDASNKYFCTTGQDKKINIWALNNGKSIRSYKPEGGDTGDLYSVRLGPAGMFCATGSFDKTIRLFDFYSGECLAKSSGHSETITGLVFSTDCKRLVSVSCDGCMFVWKLAPEITAAIKERLKELENQKTNDLEQAAKVEVPAPNEDNSAKQEILFPSDGLPTWAKTRVVEEQTPTSALLGSGFSLHSSSEKDDEVVADVGQSPRQGDLQIEELSSVLTAPRSPLPEFAPVRSLAEERAAMKKKERQKDTEDAVVRMRSKLKEIGILQKSMKKAPVEKHKVEGTGESQVESESSENVAKEPKPEVEPEKANKNKENDAPVSDLLSVPRPLESPNTRPRAVPALATSTMYTPGTPLRSAQDAQSACAYALNEIRTALANTANVLRQVEELDTNLCESVNKNTSDQFTMGVLQTSRSQIRGIVGGFKAQLTEVVTGELASVTSSSPLEGANNQLNQSMFLASSKQPPEDTRQAEQMQVMMEKLSSISALLEKVVEEKK